MSDTPRRPSTAHLIETGAVLAVVGFLLPTLIQHMVFGEPWRWAATRSVTYAVLLPTIVLLVTRRRRS
jgi:hypothetical protein